MVLKARILLLRDNLRYDWGLQPELADSGESVVLQVGGHGHQLYVNRPDRVSWCAGLERADGTKICVHTDGPDRGTPSGAVAEYVVGLMLLGHHPQGHCESSPDLESIDWDDREGLIRQLVHEDPNGCHTDEDAMAEWGKPHTLAMLRAQYLGILSENPELPDDEE